MNQNTEAALETCQNEFSKHFAGPPAGFDDVIPKTLQLLDLANPLTETRLIRYFKHRYALDKKATTQKRVWLSTDALRVREAVHAVEFIKFESSFVAEPANFDGGCAAQVAKYLRRGYATKDKETWWLWENLIDEVVEIKQPAKTSGISHAAKWAASRSLHAFYPTGTQGRKKIWLDDRLHDAPDLVVRHIEAIIDFELEFAAQHGSMSELNQERDLVDLLVKRFAPDAQQWCQHFLDGAPQPYHRALSDDYATKGCYAIFWHATDLLPLYIGESKNVRSAFQTRHAYFRGAHPMFLKFLPHEDHKKVERVLLAVFNPLSNNHHCVVHPDDL